MFALMLDVVQYQVIFTFILGHKHNSCAGANVEQADGKQTNLTRVPTLVLSTAQKPSAPRAASPALPTPSNPANPTNRSGGSIFQAQAQKAKPPQALQAALQQRPAPSGIVPGIGQQGVYSALHGRIILSDGRLSCITRATYLFKVLERLQNRNSQEIGCLKIVSFGENFHSPSLLPGCSEFKFCGDRPGAQSARCKQGSSSNK